MRRIQPTKQAAPTPIDDTTLVNTLTTKNGFNYLSLTPQCIVTALQFLGLGTLMTFSPLLATQILGVDATEVGILFTLNSLVSVVLGIPMGMIADRMGKKNLMILGLLVSGGAMVGISFAQTFAWLIVFSIINSAGMVIFSPAALGLLSNAVPRHRQSTAMGFYGGICENIGIVAGSALGGIVWSAIGPRRTFLISAIAAFIGAIICLILVKDIAARNTDRSAS
jgi:MFS family permease